MGRCPFCEVGFFFFVYVRTRRNPAGAIARNKKKLIENAQRMAVHGLPRTKKNRPTIEKNCCLFLEHTLQRTLETLHTLLLHNSGWKQIIHANETEN